MAEERELVVADAPEAPSEEEATKQELQRKMEEAREHITQTVTEIKDTVTNQYENVRSNINNALDWREQVRRRPAALSVSALSVGLLVGYAVGGALKDSRSNRRGYDYEDDYDMEDTSDGLTSSPYSSMSSYGDGSTYSDGSTASSSSNPSYSSYSQASESSGPSLFNRLKGTSAFDRLQNEMTTLGDRFVDEISSVAQNTVLPAFLSKIKEVIGVDLSGNQQSSSATTSTSHSSAAAAAGGTPQVATYAAPGTPQTTTYGATSQMKDQSGSSYGTSENTDFGSSSTT